MARVSHGNQVLIVERRLETEGARCIGQRSVERAEYEDVCAGDGTACVANGPAKFDHWLLRQGAD